jgi:hypothetical protein
LSESPASDILFSKHTLLMSLTFSAFH